MILLIISIIILIIISVLLYLFSNKSKHEHLFKKKPKVYIYRDGKIVDKVPHINFDSSASTQPFQNTCKIIDKYTNYYSSVGRSHGFLSKLSSKTLEDCRKIILDFVGATEQDICIFGKNSTECINKLSHYFNEQDIVLVSKMEHHSNLLPWKKCKVDYINITDEGRLDLNDLQTKINHYGKKLRLVAITGASNVSGIVNPIKIISEMVHQNGSLLMVDCAQLAPHIQINKKNLGIDFMCMSGHKMYAPMGIGVLIGSGTFFSSHDPCFVGGGEVKFVSLDNVVWKAPPSKDEEGTQNIIGIIAFANSILTLNKIGMENVDRYEMELFNKAYDRISKIKNIKIITPRKDVVPLISFYVKKMNHNLVGEILSNEYGISCRSGCFCAMPYIQELGKMSKCAINNVMKNVLNNDMRDMFGFVRISFSLYNTPEEVDKLCDALENITNEIIFNDYTEQDMTGNIELISMDKINYDEYFNINS